MERFADFMCSRPACFPFGSPLTSGDYVCLVETSTSIRQLNVLLAFINIVNYSHFAAAGIAIKQREKEQIANSDFHFSHHIIFSKS